jgi:hypothetical protein
MKLLYPVFACVIFVILFVISKIKYSNILLFSHWSDSTDKESLLKIFKTLSECWLYALLVSVIWFLFTYGQWLKL